MFTKDKHVFTCPDVIYLQEKNRRNAKYAIIANVVIAAGFWIYGTWLDKQMDAEFEKMDQDLPRPTED